jgi:iron complex transport system ATP-binding protein
VSAPIIEVRDFGFGLEGRAILSEVSFEVAEGAHLSIIGPNGAGKTTLLKCVLRILTGGSGSIRVAGKPLEDYTQRGLARVMSYVPQPGSHNFPFSVREFVTMGRYPHLSPFSSLSAEDRAAVDRALSLTGMNDFADRQMSTLSGGECQEALIAAALAQDARIVLLDEPTTFLDYRHQVEIRAILRQVKGTGTTIVSVTHDVNSALQTSEAILALREGRAVYSGPTADIADPAVLREIYGIGFLTAPHPVTGDSMVVPEEAG